MLGQSAPEILNYDQNLKQEFSSKIEAAINYNLNAANSFTGLCRLVQGPTPYEIYDIGSKTGISKELDQLVLNDRTRINNAQPHTFMGAEFPSPLIIDSDWRYTPESSNKIFRWASLAKGDQTLCLGNPTVFAELLTHNIESMLIDRNSLVCDLFNKFDGARVRCADIDRMRPSDCHRIFDAVFIDPPWYVDSYFRWIMIATLCSKSSGAIYIPIFGDNLRPFARLERKKIFDTLDSLGFIYERVGTIDYEVPGYERSVLRRRGLSGVGNWRLAEMFKLQMSNVNYSNLTKVLSRLDHAKDKMVKWERFKFGATSYAIDQKLIQNSREYVGSLKFLDSVSSRANKRREFNFIDSDNNISYLIPTYEGAYATQRKFCISLAEGHFCLGDGAELGTINAGYNTTQIPEFG